MEVDTGDGAISDMCEPDEEIAIDVGKAGNDTESD